MNKIKYEMSGSKCLTKCPTRTDFVQVGSAYCRLHCTHFVSVNHEKEIVVCNALLNKMFEIDDGVFE